ncbi:hypothetical protein CHS0354_025253 [Potamilus streckersoni]|uniref:Uncharacterized protein n=1 Tax=Potamilus streckersoni TaxID=2493646 RepID=A0AAE0RRR7_9BIVA|nr:hypothetical protein CHS0354_025253 [Potamilus streckersoni]
MASSNETSSFSTSSTTTTTSTPTTTSTKVPPTTLTTITTGADTKTDNTQELSAGEIAGIAIGVIAFIIIIVAIIVFIAVRRRRHSRRPLSAGEPQDEGKKVLAENSQKRTENKYVKKDVPKVNNSEVFYENPAAEQQDYYNVDEQNFDSSVHAAQAKGSEKQVIQKQNSVPTMNAPPPPTVDNRTSMPVEIAPNCPVIDEDECDEDEYIIPEDPSKITVAKRPPYTGSKTQNNDGELYLDMSAPHGEELYIDPDSGQEQRSYINFDAKSKPMEDQERKGGPKDYVNLSKQKRGVAFGVHPKEINTTPRLVDTTPVTTGDAENYQNVLYENKPKQNKKPQRRK